jgi:S1-C subfamily serine protease
MWPLPEKAGFILERDDPSLLREVAPGSAAGEAGLQAGDRLVRVGEERVRSQADVQWALHQAPPSDASVPVTSLRNRETRKATLRLARDWKIPSDADFSWRATMWSLKPMPGFGGRTLKDEDLRTAGLEPGTFALRVEYIVDWGEDAATGRSARNAGLKKGDLILSVDGKKDFYSERHFQSWFRFTRKAGSAASLEVLRPAGKDSQAERMRIDLPVLP